VKLKQRHQLKFRIAPKDASRVKAYCAARDITETALCQAAIEQYLALTSVQDVLLRRLDRIAHELSKLNTGIELLSETFATFVQLWLAHNPEIDERDKAAAQRDVVRRYQRFITFVVRTIGDERSTLLHRLIGTRLPLADAAELDLVRSRGAPSAPTVGPHMAAEVTP
jgi:hypothetical protein